MKLSIHSARLPVFGTLLVLVLFYLTASIRYDGFFSSAVLINLLRDNAFLGLAALGMTFVILSGGIDLSVGAMIGFSSILIASLVSVHQLHPLAATLLVLAAGAVYGLLVGLVIRIFTLPPFLVTLAGMFFLRGMGFVISLKTISITHPLYEQIDSISYSFFPATACVFLLATAVAFYVAHHTSFGRNVYAVGGNEQSALLMGLPVKATIIRVYALSGFCSALAGVVYTIYTSSGNASAGTTLELDAIASVVIGGTLLSGGVGYVLGTLLGVMILGVVQTIISFEGTLSSWWTKIVIGILLLLFILLQRLIQARGLLKKH